jgi:hypothetical protein
VEQAGDSGCSGQKADRKYGHIVTVTRKNGALYTTSFYACSSYSVMMLNPEQFNALGNAAPNIEMPTVVALPARRK